MVSAENIQHRAEKIVVMHLRIYMYVHTHTHTPNRKRIHETEGQGGSHLGGFGGRKGKGGMV